MVALSMRALEIGEHPQAFPPPMQVLLDEERARLAIAVEEARRRVGAAQAAAEPVLARGKLEAGALERVRGLREYFEMKDRAGHLADQVVDWGSVGVQGYYLINESGQHGPFEFEQMVDLGATQLVV